MIMPRFPAFLRPRVHRRAHRRDGLAEADEDRFAHHEVADVEFGDFGERGDGLGGRIIEPVAGMDLQPGGTPQLCALGDALPFGGGLCRVAVDHGVAPGAGMDFDHRRAQLCGHLDLARVGGDEQRHPHAGVVQSCDERF